MLHLSELVVLVLVRLEYQVFGFRLAKIKNQQFIKIIRGKIEETTNSTFDIIQIQIHTKIRIRLLIKVI